MGRYVSQSGVTAGDLVPGHLSARDLVQLTQDDAASGDVDQDVLDGVVAAAEDEIDGYLGARYGLPLATTPPMVRTLACRITAYRLHLRRPQSVSEERSSDYGRAIKLLEKIATGEITLGTQPEVAANSERIIRVNAGAPIAGRANLSGF